MQPLETLHLAVTVNLRLIVTLCPVSQMFVSKRLTVSKIPLLALQTLIAAPSHAVQPLQVLQVNVFQTVLQPKPRVNLMMIVHVPTTQNVPPTTV